MKKLYRTLAIGALLGSLQAPLQAESWAQARLRRTREAAQRAAQKTRSAAQRGYQRIQSAAQTGYHRTREFGSRVKRVANRSGKTIAQFAQDHKKELIAAGVAVATAAAAAAAIIAANKNQSADERPPSFEIPTKTQEMDRAYDTLGVSRGGSREEVRRAYRKLVREYHPDRISRTGYSLEEANERTKEITAAYALLDMQLPA